MKRGRLFIFILSLLLVMSLGVVSAVCPDGIIDVDEDCDDGNVFTGDGCNGSCAVETNWDCIGEPSVCTECGDDTKNGAEVCDGTDFGLADCVSLGFNGGGTPICASDCKSIDTSSCISIGPTADFNVNVSSGLVSLVVLATDSSTAGDVDISSYSWDCDNDGTPEGNGADLTTFECVYDTPDTYTLELTVTDAREEEVIATQEILAKPNCGVPAVGEVCINVPQNMCTPDFESGLGCDENAADRYCKLLNYDSYVSGSKNCDTAGSHTLGSWATDSLTGSCGLGADTWILSMKCYGDGGVPPGDCTDTDATVENPYFVEGTATADGTTSTDICTAGDLTEYFCEGGQVKSKQINCSEGCNLDGLGACKVPEQGLYCVADATLDLPKASPKSRDESNEDADADGNDDIYYCSLLLNWEPALDLTEDCTDDYECISNSCVDEKCFSVTGALQEQRSILIRIWCFLTNMQSYFNEDLKIDYCICALGNDDAYWNDVPTKPQCDI